MLILLTPVTIIFLAACGSQKSISLIDKESRLNAVASNEREILEQLTEGNGLWYIEANPYSSYISVSKKTSAAYSKNRFDFSTSSWTGSRFITNRASYVDQSEYYSLADNEVVIREDYPYQRKVFRCKFHVADSEMDFNCDLISDRSSPYIIGDWAEGFRRESIQSRFALSR
jgi:hypothetical protein